MSNLKLSFNKIENNIHFDEINYEHKMRLSISSFALSVIENDTFIYGYSTNGSVLNAIFRNMREFYLDNDQENDDVFVYNSYKKARDDLMSITKKEDVLNAKRSAMRTLRSDESLAKLFTEIGPKMKDRKGGYTRRLKLENRRGDDAPVVLVSWVD